MKNDYNFLGLAKKANALYIGQDKVLFALNSNAEFFVLISTDISQTLLRKLHAKALNHSVTIIETNLTRGELGSLLGINSSSIIAIEKSNPFAKKIKQIDILQNNN